MLQSARDLLGKVWHATAGGNEHGNTNSMRDAQKEFAEGGITLALVTRNPLPSPNELGIDLIAYLNGLGKAVGKLRRQGLKEEYDLNLPTP